MTLHEQARGAYLDALEAIASINYQLAVEQERGGANGGVWRAKAEFALAKYVRELQQVVWALEPCRCSGE